MIRWSYMEKTDSLFEPPTVLSCLHTSLVQNSVIKEFNKDLKGLFHVFFCVILSNPVNITTNLRLSWQI